MHRYQEFAPHPALATHVARLWFSETAPGAEPVRFRVLPDNCIDILWQADVPQGFAVGMMSRAIHVTDAQPVQTVAVRFLPGAARAFLDLPLCDLQDGRHAMGDLWSRADAEALAASLWERELPVRARLAIIERFLLARLRAASAPSGLLVREAIRLIEAADGAVRIEELAGSLGVSRQHLARQFSERVGLNAKTFAMVSRFRRASAQARAQRGKALDWAALAGACGYYDQAHLIHEFQMFAGEAPESFLRS